MADREKRRRRGMIAGAVTLGAFTTDLWLTDFRGLGQYALATTSQGRFFYRLGGYRAGDTAVQDDVTVATLGDDGAVGNDGSGRPHVAIANFSNQMIGLYRNEGNGFFIDEAPASAVGRASLLSLGFGLFFFDFDLDGRSDLFVANGHIEDDIARVQPRVRYAQPPHLFRNAGGRKFLAPRSSSRCGHGPAHSGSSLSRARHVCPSCATRRMEDGAGAARHEVVEGVHRERAVSRRRAPDRECPCGPGRNGR